MISDPVKPAPDPVTPAVGESSASETAARLVNERREGSPKSSTERVRAHRARQRGERTQASAPPADAPAPITDEEREAAGMAFAFIWDLAVVPLAKGNLRSVDEKQALRAGKCLAPLVQKYAPFVAAWQLEISAVGVIAAIARECKQEPPKPADVPDPEGDMEMTR